jgi:SOS-response transcriptional repressor LexA
MGSAVDSDAGMGGMTTVEPLEEHARVLTWRRRKILRFIQDFTRRQGYPPSLREIGAAVKLAPSSVSYHRSILAKNGYLSHGPGQPRASVAQPLARRGC